LCSNWKLNCTIKAINMPTKSCLKSTTYKMTILQQLQIAISAMVYCCRMLESRWTRFWNWHPVSNRFAFDMKS
jgi:hypothetical protein